MSITTSLASVAIGADAGASYSSVRRGCTARFLSSVGDDASVARFLWVYAAGSHRSAPEPDHQTSQCLFHSVVLDGVDERVYADVQVGQKDGGRDQGAHIARRLLSDTGDKRKDIYREPADDKSHINDHRCLDDVPLDSFGFHLRCVHLC